MHALLIEDDEALGATVVRGLEQHGVTVEWSRDATSGLAALASHPAYDVVLLDLGLPDLDGLEVCRRVRATSNVPIIMVTARDEEVDRVVGLELGADDYVPKPFGIRELVARMRAVTRRAGPEPAAPATSGLVVDARAHRATLDGVDLALTPLEFDVLAVLAADPGAVVRRDALVREVWGAPWSGAARTLDVHVAGLRRKLGADRVETVRGVGFRLAP